MTTNREPAERGRYAVYEHPDGGVIIGRSTGLCQTCSACDCGEQQEPLDLSRAGVMKTLIKMRGRIPAGLRGVIPK